MLPHKSYLQTQFVNKADSRMYCNEESLRMRTKGKNHQMHVIQFLGVEGACGLLFYFPFSPHNFLISQFSQQWPCEVASFAFPHKGLQKLLYAEFISEKHASNRNLVTLAIHCEQANVMINRNGMMPANLRKFKAKQIKCVLISWWGFVCYMYKRKTSSQSNLEPQTFFLHSEF